MLNNIKDFQTNKNSFRKTPEAYNSNPLAKTTNTVQNSAYIFFTLG